MHSKYTMEIFDFYTELIILLHILITLPCLKHCIVEIPLRAGLIPVSLISDACTKCSDRRDIVLRMRWCAQNTQWNNTHSRKLHMYKCLATMWIHRITTLHRLSVTSCLVMMPGIVGTCKVASNPGFPFEIFLQSCETKSGTESLGSRLHVWYNCHNRLDYFLTTQHYPSCRATHAHVVQVRAQKEL